MRRLVIISSNNTGHGHTSITTSLLEQLERYPDVRTDVVQGFRLMSETMQRASGLYGPMTRYSKDLWKWSFEISQQSPKVTNELVARMMHDNFMKMLEQKHPDMILTVHSLFAGSVINILEEYHLDIPHVTLIADMVDLHATWCEPRSMLTICPTEESAAVCRIRGCDPDRLLVTGFPARRQFCDAARGFTRGDFPTDRPLRFLIMSGGEGSGNLRRYAEVLLESFECEVTVICGRNARLKKLLDDTVAARYGGRAHILGFVSDVAQHMLHNDIIIARGSPNSLTEAIVCNIPIICIGALPGQEEHNPLLMERHDLGRICESPKRLPDVVRQLTDNGGAVWRHLRDGQQKYRNLNAAADIVDAVCARLKPLDYTVPPYKIKNPLQDMIETQKEKREAGAQPKGGDAYFEE